MFHARRPFPAGIAAFLFDLDGTLVRTPIDFAGMKRSVFELVASTGIDPAPVESLDVLSVIARAESELPDAAPFAAEAERLLAGFEWDAADVAEELPGAIDTLKLLRDRGCRIAIVTRNCRRAVERTLERVGLPHDLLLTRSDVARVKPDPEHLLAAARSFGLKPEACVMVGDHPMDVRAAHDAGMYGIAVQSRDPSPDAFRSVEPDLILPGVGDLLPWISASSSSTGTLGTCSGPVSTR